MQLSYESYEECRRNLTRARIEIRHLRGILAVAKDAMRESMENTQDPEAKAALSWTLGLIKEWQHGHDA